MGRTTNLSTGVTRLDLVVGHAEWREDSYIVVGDRYLPSRIDVVFAGGSDSPQPALEFTIEIIRGVPAVTRLELRIREGGRGVRPNDLDNVRRRLNDWTEEIVAASMMTVMSDDGDRVVVVDRPDKRANLKATRTMAASARRKITPEHLERVAEVFRQDDGGVEAVAFKLGTSYRSAARWVQKAREAGLL